MLATTYNKVKADGKAFEVIFVSSDRDAGSWKEYFDEMPWLAVPFEDQARIAAIKSHFQIRGIPSLVLLDGDTLTPYNITARQNLASDSNGENFPWEE